MLLTLEAVGERCRRRPSAGQQPPAAAPRRQRPHPASAPAPAASSYAGGADLECDMLVLGAGPGGYSAAFRAADLGMKVVLVERYATLGGVCLNVGCIPSKALLHVAAVMDEVSHFESLGVSFGKPTIELDKLRAHKAKVVGKLTGGLTAMAKMRKVTVVRGVGEFLDPYHLQVRGDHRGGARRTPARSRPSSSRTASSRPVRRRCGCRSCPRTRAWWIPPARWNWRATPSAC